MTDLNEIMEIKRKIQENLIQDPEDLNYHYILHDR